MSKKPFFIALFIGVLFLIALVSVGIRSIDGDLSVPKPIIEATPPVIKVVATTTPAFDTSPLVLEKPLANELVLSPFTIRGKLPGTWYFEGSFPIHIEDTAGNILGNGFATAKGNWMTTDLVPFEAKITFKKTNADEGFLVFKNDNPSGDPKNSKEVRLPILFKLYLQ